LIILRYSVRLQSQRKSVGFESNAMIEITGDISIHEDELIFKVSRSGGPGGQNINKVSTRVTLFFDVTKSGSFSDVQKQQILARLATRADKNGVVRVVSQRFRTQKENRKAAFERLGELLRQALKTPMVRKKTATPYVVKQQRLEEKRRRSLLKQQRAKRTWAKDLAD